MILFLVMRGNLSGVPVNFLHSWHFWLIFAKYLATCKNVKCSYLNNVSHTVVCVLILYKMTMPITINIITTKQRPEMGNLGKKGHFRTQSDPKTPKMIYSRLCPYPFCWPICIIQPEHSYVHWTLREKFIFRCICIT